MSIALGSPESERERRQQQQTEQQQALVRSRLLQKLLLPSPDIRQFLNDLVYSQAVVVAGTEAAAFLIEDVSADGKARLQNVAHIRPDNSAADVRQAALQAFAEIIGSCIKEGKDGAVDVGGNELDKDPQYCLVTLLRAEGRIIAATSVITRCRDVARAQQRLESMQLVAGYFDYYLLRRNNEQLKLTTANHQDVLQYATAVGTSEGFKNAVNNLCNELAARTGAARVSVGWVQGMVKTVVKLKGLSHTEQFDKKQELSVQIVKVMEECIDQEEIVQFDPTPAGLSTQNITRESAALSRMEGGNRVMTLPLRRKGEICAVMTLEFPTTKPPTEQETTGLAVAAEMLGPVLYDRYQNDRWLITKFGLWCRDSAQWAVGPKHWLAKLIIIFSIPLLLVLCGVLYRPMDFVRAPFAFSSTEKRLVSAPFEGTIRTVHRIPGDTVEAGTPLLEFETRELEKQLLEAQARLAQARLRYDILLADRDDRGQPRTAEALVEFEKMNEAQAQIDLFKLQLDKAVLKAPIAGEVVQQDLRERVSDTVRQGEPLFEIARIDNLRVEISLSERDVQRTQEGARGELRTASRPDQTFYFTVDRIIPAGKPEEGKNVFTVIGTIDAGTPQEVLAAWRPGMKGEVAIEDRPRALIYQWTHRLVEWVRLKLWI